jgi:pre-rRNA-processing protein TSR1
MKVEPAILVEPDQEDADSLVSSNDPDDLANEQTWPTEEEMNEKHEDMVEEPLPDASKGTTPRVVKRVPKGMSEYQAAWIIDESDDDDGDEETSETVEMDASITDEEEMQDLVMEDDDAEDNIPRHVDFHDLDDEEEERQ